VSKLIRDAALLVHLAIRALCLDSITAAKTAGALAQDAGRHHEGLNERLRIFDRHLVSDFISNTCEFLDDVHGGGVEEAPSSQPRRIDKVDRVDDERIAFPPTYAVPVVVGLTRRPRVPLAAIRRDVAEFRGAAAVIGIRSIEEDDVILLLDDPPGRAMPWESQRLAGHDRIELVRPLIEFLNLVPMTTEKKPVNRPPERRSAPELESKA
jgi:hypothetical protein